MAGFRTWTDEEFLTAADINGYFMGQVVTRFASEVERDAQLASPVAGMVSYVTGVGLQMYDGTTWAAVASAAYTTADRPAAALVPVGTAIFDLTLDRPLWSDGGAWVPAVATAADVGLYNVNDTADTAKPVSTAQAAAITAAVAVKVSKSGDTMTGDLSFSTLGKSIRVKEGTNGRAGLATLAAGTVTVATTATTANSRIQLTAQSLGTVTAPSALTVSARTAGTSFTILASQATDTSTVAWLMTEPA